MRDGWDECVTYRELLGRYGALGRGCRGDPSRRARSLLRSLPLPASEFAFGRSAVHIRNARTIVVLEGWRAARVRVLVTAVQRCWRRWSQARAAARVIQRAYRHYRMRAGARANVVARRAAIIIQRNYRLWVRRRYLTSLWSHLPEGHLSPLCRSWPGRVSAQLRHTDELLAALHHRWRCHRYRFCFDQTARNRMREKVTASILFKDKKQSYPCSVAHPFVGDYVRLRASAVWRARGVRADGYVVFADVVGKVSRTGRVQPVLAVLSTAALLLLEPRSLRVRRRLPAGRLLRLWLSPTADDLLGVTVAEGDAGCAGGGARGDLLLRALHCIELATKLYLVVQHASGVAPPVHLAPSTTLTLHQDALTITVHPRGDYPHGDRQTAILRRGSELNVLL